MRLNLLFAVAGLAAVGSAQQKLKVCKCFPLGILSIV